MIVLDIETTGTDPKKHCMLSLGAVDYDSGEEFYGECSVYNNSLIDPIAMQINGFKLEDVRSGKQFAYELYESFLAWSFGTEDNMLAGHNIGHLDLLFLEAEHERRYLAKYKDIPAIEFAKFPFGYRTLDLHSLAFAKLGKSLSHEGICDALGMPREPKPHNALAGARSERDAFKLLLKDKPIDIFARGYDAGSSNNISLPDAIEAEFGK
jgi:DNA polymerase III epsilon subunit-like protein